MTEGWANVTSMRWVMVALLVALELAYVTVGMTRSVTLVRLQ